MKFVPRPFQSIIIDHGQSNNRCNVWADMGLGKTVAALTLLDNLSLVEDCYPALVIAPLRVARGVWPAEQRKWDHLKGLRISPVIGSEQDRKLALRAAADIYTINYENLQWLIMQRLNRGAAWPFRTVIADESSKLKGFRLRSGGVRAAALARVAHHAKLSRWINLTGTPAPNGLSDLWGQQWFVDAGAALGRSYTSFVERWFRPSFNGYGIEPLPFAEQQIHDALKPTTVTIKAGDWFDLEAPIKNKIYVDLPKAARKAYNEMEAQMYMELEGISFEAFSAAARTMKCLQLANGAVYSDKTNTSWTEAHKVKLEALDDIIEEAAGANILVAYNFVSDLARLKTRYKHGLHLRTDKDIDRWNDGKVRLAFAHPKSAGHGLNLQYGGNILVFFGLDWNLEEHDQIIERIGPVRQLQAGLDRPVYLHYILARHTLDDAIMERLSTKRVVQDILKAAMRYRAAA